ncbi:hypothetical protein T06_9239 [Trichinella sp. T6]|nr:hypothetical protein T06_9239 [Trichinella sp. T6]
MKWCAITDGKLGVSSGGKNTSALLGTSDADDEDSNHLPVDIPSVKGKWPYRYLSELPLRYVKTIEDVWIPYTMCHNGCHIIYTSNTVQYLERVRMNDILFILIIVEFAIKWFVASRRVLLMFVTILGSARREYANFYLPWGISGGHAWG